MHEFDSWASVQADRSMQFDWDDAMGNSARREAGLRLEKMRQVGGVRCGGVDSGGARQVSLGSIPRSDPAWAFDDGSVFTITRLAGLGRVGCPPPTPPPYR